MSPTLRAVDRLAEALGILPRDLLSEIADYAAGGDHLM
jgi:hypothetical protein